MFLQAKKAMLPTTDPIIIRPTNMLNRRRFIQALAVAASVPALPGASARGAVNGTYGPLVSDPARVIDLPAGFTYTVIASRGEEMDDGLLIPGLADGMAAFPGKRGEVILVCNHEIHPDERGESPFGLSAERLARTEKQFVYDLGDERTPGLGGTTTIRYDVKNRRRTRMHMSLIGTENNCAGGPTPWGSWLSCEECFFDAGTAFEYGSVIHREQQHGYIFEVPAAAKGPVQPVPLKAMGRFEHEAAAVNPASGVIYLSEDRHRSLLYRFIPDVKGELQRGGRLQALAIAAAPGFDTRNWADPQGMPVAQWYETDWIDLEDADSPLNDLRLRGGAAGAARFARGEGLTFADGELIMAATIGGQQRLGQLFNYIPSPLEGTAGEASQPGRLRLLAESTTDSLLRHADNLTLSPWGDIVACEDTAGHCGLVGITPDGQQYALADNPYTNSELAGICFSPDGTIMFFNIQGRGLTLAVTGPWSVLS